MLEPSKDPTEIHRCRGSQLPRYPCPGWVQVLLRSCRGQRVWSRNRLLKPRPLTAEPSLPGVECLRAKSRPCDTALPSSLSHGQSRDNEVANWRQLAAVRLKQVDPKEAEPLAPATAKVFVQQQGGAKRCRRLRDAKVVMLELNSAEPLKAADCTVLLFLTKPSCAPFANRCQRVHHTSFSESTT